MGTCYLLISLILLHTEKLILTKRAVSQRNGDHILSIICVNSLELFLHLNENNCLTPLLQSTAESVITIIVHKRPCTCLCCSLKAKTSWPPHDERDTPHSLKEKLPRTRKLFSLFKNTDKQCIAGSCFSISFVMVNRWCCAQLNSRPSTGIIRGTKEDKKICLPSG